MFAKISRRKRKLKNTTFGDFLLYLPTLTEECREDSLSKLNAADCPEYLFSEDCPQNLNAITFGQYSDICNAMKPENQAGMMIEFCHILFKVDDADIMNANVFDIFGFSTMVCKETERITKLFNSINTIHSPEETQAGIDKLQFGVFGMLDWYARRMGITDHNEVNQIAWVRIFQCMKNDSEEAAFQKRLQKVYNDKIKRK